MDPKKTTHHSMKDAKARTATGETQCTDSPQRLLSSEMYLHSCSSPSLKCLVLAPGGCVRAFSWVSRMAWIGQAHHFAQSDTDLGVQAKRIQGLERDEQTFHQTRETISPQVWFGEPLAQTEIICKIMNQRLQRHG